MYTLSDYRRMAADPVRTAAYAEALRRTVRPGHVVADIGTGTGIFALLACQLGARRVYALEPDPIIELARALAAANGCADRIEFIQDLSTRVVLPERADVIVSDLRGVLPLSGQHLPAIIDARERLRAPGGVLVPLEDTIWAAPAEAPDIYRVLVSPWDDAWYGLDARPARQAAVSAWSKVHLHPDQLLSPPQRWTALQYSSVEHHDVNGQMIWRLSRAGTCHGLGVWFETVLVDGVGFSTGPGTPELIYGSGFFPLSSPIPVAPGDEVTVVLRARLAGEDYVWHWETVVRDGARPDRVKAEFSQSNFFGTMPAVTDLQKRGGTYVPVVNEEGEIDRFILSHMDGQISLTDIARQTAVQFPQRFPRWQDALPRVGSLSQRYSR